MKVSVIVPVYNPGEHVDPCVDSLLGQSMAPSEHELIFVDDGSTDGTGARLDALAEGHPHVRVRHIPNSGWPGRPRNVGLEMAGGEFVYFVDNDDWLGREALERLYGAAVEGDADVVVGKVVGHRRWVPRGIFRRNVHGLTVEEAPFGLLTPHKLFRRAVLEQHGIRFPEGRRSLEDHPFVVMAYFRARRISILADYPCYHWVNHGRETNASLAPPDPASYFASVRTVLDLLDAETEPGELRDRLYMRWYRGKLLGRLNGRQFQRNEEGYMRRVLEEVRALVVERFPAHLDEALTLRDRLRAQLIRRGSFDGLRALADFETALRAEARARRVRSQDGEVVLEIDAALRGDGAAFSHTGEAVTWRPPTALAAALDADELDVTEALARPRLHVVIVSTEGVGYEQQVEVSAAAPVAERRGGVTPRLTAVARIRTQAAAAGAALSPGLWKVRANVAFGGFSDLTPVHRGGDPLYLRVRPGGVSPWPSAPRRLARRVPGLPVVARIVRGLTRRGAARGSPTRR
jgi:poly(ribitol-phosphate) beta-N-acetylglucosaminyltransferase